MIVKHSLVILQHHCEAVNEAFRRLYAKGLVHRGTYPVNWCCHLQSAISDIEVDHVALEKKTKLKVPGYDKPVEFGIMYDVAYKVEGKRCCCKKKEEIRSDFFCRQ